MNDKIKHGTIKIVAAVMLAVAGVTNLFVNQGLLNQRHWWNIVITIVGSWAMLSIAYDVFKRARGG